MLSFVDRYFTLKKLRKETEYKVFDSFSNRAFSSKYFKSIFLPVSHLNLNELKMLLKREEEKIKRHGYLQDASFSEINDLAFDVLNNMIFTPKAIPENRKNLFKKLSPTHLLDAWEYYDDKEKEQVVKTLQKQEILKDEKSVDEIIKIIDETYSKAKSYSSAEDFASSNEDMMRKFSDLFNTSDEVGDGHSPFRSSFKNPDWEMVKEVRRIIRNLKSPRITEIKEEGFIGKKLNRKFVYELSIYPFEIKKEKKQINKPNIGIIIDFSGSMSGNPEINAKTLAVALLQERVVNEVLVKSEYFEEIVSSVTQLRSKPPSGDEGFDTLKTKEYIKDKDVIIVITDLIIDEDERKGLAKFLNDVRMKTIILVVSEKNVDEYKEDLPFRRYKFSEKKDLITVAKKLTKEVR